MAISYKKALKTLTIKTVGGTTVTAADTATDPIGSDALAEFEAKATMHVRKTSGVTEIPFHAVDTVDVAVTTQDATRKDPYCAEETSDDSGDDSGDENGGN